MIRNPFSKGKHVSKFGRMLSGMTAGLMAATSIIGTNGNFLVSNALVDLGTFTYATETDMGSANKYAAFAYSYYQSNHMEGTFACENFHPSGNDAFGTSHNVDKYVDPNENFLYIGNSFGNVDGLSDELKMVQQTNGMDGEDLQWIMIIPDNVRIVTEGINNGNGIQLVSEDGSYKSNAFNEKKNLAKEIYHKNEVTYNINFIQALTSLQTYQQYWKNVDTCGDDAGQTTVTKSPETVDPNDRVLDIACAEGGNVVTLTSEELRGNNINIHAKDGVQDYSLIINVTDLSDGDTFMRNIKIDDSEASYGPQAQKLLFNMLGDDAETYTFGQTDQGVILAPVNQIKIQDGSHNGNVMGFIVENVNCQIHQNGFRQLPVNGAKANVVISKKAVNGEDELPGAKLTLTNSNISSNDWAAILTATANANEGIQFTAVDGGISWVSGSKEVTVTGLPDARGYTLKETADNGAKVFDSNGTPYKVIDSEFTFDLVDNKVTNVTNGAPAAASGSNEKGYFDDSETNTNKITICDAEKFYANVELGKITAGGDPLSGVSLELSAKDDSNRTVELSRDNFPENADGFSVNNGAIKWTSSTSAFTFRDLPDGKYTFKELVIPEGYTAPNGTTVSFTVKNGKVYDATGKPMAEPYHFDIINEQATATNKTNIVIDKKAVTGGGEVVGAKLTLTNENVDNWDDIYNDTKDSSHNVTKVTKGRKTIGITWESTSTALTIKGLPAEKSGYVLKEEAANGGTLIGGKYTVIPSEFKFSIDDEGYVEFDTDENAPTNENKPANGDGYFGVNGKTITVWDAQTTDIVISKTDITGEKELKGAKLTLTGNADMTNVKKAEGCNVADANITFSAANNSVQWTSDGVNELKLTGLTNGTYTLEETGANSDGTVELDGETYKVIPSKVTFTVENGKIKNVKLGTKAAATAFNKSAKDSYVVANAQNNKITVCDAEKYPKADISVNKTDITGETEVKGAKLTLKNTALSGTDWANIVRKTNEGLTTAVVKAVNGGGIEWVSGDSAVQLKGLPENGTYSLAETAAQDEINVGGKTYTIIPSEVKFTIKNGKVTKVSGTTAKDAKGNGYYKLGTDTITVCDAERTNFKLNKTDVTGQKEVKGATITITSSDKTISWNRMKSYNADNTRLTWTTNSVSWVSDGKAVDLVGFENGTYTLKETATAGQKITDGTDEYEVIDSAYTFKVENGKVTVTNAKTAFNANALEGYVVNKNNVVTICDAKKIPENTDVLIDKADITGEKELKGAKLTIFAEDGKTVVIDEWTSDGKTAKKVSLPNGTYVLKETGGEFTVGGKTYKVLTSEVAFTVNNGTVTARGAKTTADKNSRESYALFDGTNKITICDAERIPVVLNKTDITGEEEIAGAKITIRRKNGTATYSWNSVIGETKSFYLDDGDYVLIEEAVEGTKIVDRDGKAYTVIPSKVEFSVKDGKVTSTSAKTAFDKNATEGYVVADGNKLTICDAERTADVTISKTAVSGEDELPGAQLTLTSKTADIANVTVEGVKPSTQNAKTIVWTSGTKPAQIKGLPDGEYTLEETGGEFTVDGVTYTVIDSEITFTVKNGEITDVSKNVKDNKDTTSETSYAYADKANNKITICDAERPDNVTISKTAVSGEDELPGAQLTLTSKTADIANVTVEGVKPSTQNAKTIVWTSGTKPAQIKGLPDGEYTLEETGGEFTVEGVTYTVIDSEITFTVKNGKITDVSKNVKDKKDTTSETSYAYADKANNKITICDAERPNNIKINKFEITGEKEIAGAKLVVTNVDTQETLEWTSKLKETWEFFLEDGTYTLEETGETFKDDKGSEYEVIDSVLKFKVENGKVTVTENKTEKNTETGYYEYDSKTDIIKVCDAQKITKNKVIINKFDITGENEVVGAVLTLKDSSGSVIGEPWTSTANKAWEVQLEDGTYTLEETGTEDITYNGVTYTVIDSALTFDIVDGKVKVSDANNGRTNVGENGEGYFDVTGNTIVVCDAFRTSVTLDKTDVTGEEEVTGAKITITDSKGEVVDTWVSDGTKHVVKNLENGTYTLTETSDEGKPITDKDGNEYEVIDSEIKFTVQNGKVTVTGAKTEIDKSATEGYVVSKGTEITICDAKKIFKTTVTLDKTDVTGEEEVTGAKITITDSKGEVVDTWVSDGTKHEIKDLPDGEYTLTETSDEGKPITDKDGNEYDVIDSEIKFTIKNGKVTVTGAKTEIDKDATEGYVVSKGSEITICDAKKVGGPEKTTVKINKFDITGENELPGAVLTLIDKDGNTVETWTSKVGEVWETELEDGEYTLREEGDQIVVDNEIYDVITSELKFKVEDGKVTFTDNKTEKNDKTGYYDYDEASEIIKVCDAKKTVKTTVTLNKTDVTGEEELAGATLIIKDKDGNEVASWTSVIGETKTFELENGEYELIETGDKITDKDGNEYEVIDSSLKFKVEDGKVIVTEGKTELDTDKGYYDFDEASNIIRISDAKKAVKTTVTLNKTDVTGEEELAGATLTIRSTDGNTEFSWISVIGETKTFELENGEYELIETGDKITDKDGNEYEVIDSSLKFKVQDGKVIVTEGKTELDTDKGYYDFDEASNIIRVSGAKKAKNIDNDDSERDQDTTTGEDDTSKPDDSNGTDKPEESSRVPSYEESSRPADDDNSKRTPDLDDDSKGGDTTPDSESSKSEDSSNGDSSKPTPVKDNSAKDNSAKDNSSSKATATTTTTRTTTTATSNGNPGTGARVVINSVELIAAIGLCFAALNRRKKDDDDEDER